MATSFPLQLNQFETFRRLIVLQAEDTTPIDLTNTEVEGEIRRRHTDLAAAATFACEKTGNPGEVEIILTSEQSGLLTGGSNSRPTYVYDFVMIRTDTNERMRLFGGPLTVCPGVTR